MRNRKALLAIALAVPPAVWYLLPGGRMQQTPLTMQAQTTGGVTLRTTAYGHEFRQDDWPAVALGPDGSIWAAWLSYNDGRDDIAIRRYQNGKWGNMMWVPGTSGDSWMPQLAVDARNRVWVVWSQMENDNWDLYARPFNPAIQQWEPRQRLTTHAMPDIHPRLAAGANGRFAFVWQSFRERHSNILMMEFDGEKFLPEVRVTNHAGNDWFPAIALDSRGVAWVAYDSHRNGNYDVLLSRVEKGKPAEEMSVAATSMMEAQASVAVDTAGRVWVAYESGMPFWGKDTGYVVRNTATGKPLGDLREARIRCWAGGQWRDPAPVSAAFRKEVAHHPQVFSDGRGSVYVASALRLAGGPANARGRKLAFWEYWLTHFDGAKWSDSFVLPDSRGRSSTRAGAVVDNDGKFWLAWPTDGRREGNFHRPLRQRVMIASLDAAAYTKESSWTGTPPSAVDASKPDHPNEAGDVRAARNYVASINGRKLRLLRGDFHRHTELSWDGGGATDGSLPEFYRYMIDAASLDFGASTDHQGGAWPYWWWYTQKMTDMFHVPGAYVAIFGYERSPQWPKGNRNIFWAKRSQARITPLYMKESAPGYGLPAGPTGDESGVGMRDAFDNDTQLLYDDIRKTKPLIIAHTTGTFMGTDWKEFDQALEPVVEIFQGARTSYEKVGAPLVADPARDAEHIAVAQYKPEGMVSVALAKGYRLGIIASSDHGSTHISYAMVYTDNPTREGILEAFRKRQVYGATDNIVLDVRMGSHFMGEEFTLASPERIQVKARGTKPVSKVFVLKDSKEIYSAAPGKQDVDFTFADREPSKGFHHYYVRLEQEDGKVAWSSPFFVTYR
ncbi:MAG: hypothetical protein JST93_26855 [Acidobacteria bacterium]|nr:hypothetical protein [Acidobacteriota bacterium]